MARERGNIACEECLGRVGGDASQRRRAHTPKAPREHGDAVPLDESRRGDGPRVLTVGEEQRDLSRAQAATIAEELPRGIKAVGDRGPAACPHCIDSRVDLGRVVRPWHARRRIRCEGHHREARRVHSEEVLVHLGRLRLGFGLRLGHGLRLGLRFGPGLRLSVRSREKAFLSVPSRRDGPAPWRRPSALRPPP